MRPWAFGFRVRRHGPRRAVTGSHATTLRVLGTRRDGPALPEPLLRRRLHGPRPWPVDRLRPPGALHNRPQRPAATPTAHRERGQMRLEVLMRYALHGARRPRIDRPRAAGYWPAKRMLVVSWCSSPSRSPNRCPAATTAVVSNPPRSATKSRSSARPMVSSCRSSTAPGSRPKAPGAKPLHRLLLTVDGLALDQDRAQEHPQARGVGQPAAAVSRGDEARQVSRQVESIDEMVEERQWTQTHGPHASDLVVRPCPLPGSLTGPKLS